MKTSIMYLFTRTPLHVGAGSSVGAIDLPVQRERHTGHPFIPGSSIKGVLRDMLSREPEMKSHVDKMFGTQEEAGRISFGEAKLLAFPVRSARGSFAWVTCPLALERFRREHGELEKLAAPAEPTNMHCLAGEKVLLKNGNETGVVLEEYRFQCDAVFPANWETTLLGLLDDVVWKTGAGRLVLLSNGDFAHFVKNACEVAQHVSIKPETGTAKPGALFNIEAVPSETLFVASVVSLAREAGEVEALKKALDKQPLVQFGGDSTTGLGFCTVRMA